MARLAFKADSSFFRKIAMGAVGTRAACANLAGYGHAMVELERGSTDTKLWKDVKRKRVRIPDLVCTSCGLRVESRTKTDPDLSMSHSPGEEARAWDFGMVDRDLIAFPVCKATGESYWSSGRLRAEFSYWHERNWVRWQPNGFINYFSVEAFRSSPPARSNTKGVTEGSETSIAWNATFSSRAGVVEAVSPDRITIRRASDGHRYTWKVPRDQRIAVASGQEVAQDQVIASAVPPFATVELMCPEKLPTGYVSQLLRSRERTLRFTGVKLARLRRDDSVHGEISALAADPEEDVYIRLEAASYLASVCDSPAADLFEPYCSSTDRQTQLEAVIALGEAATDDAIPLLASVLNNHERPYFLRSAAAWSLSRVEKPDAFSWLIRAFADVDPDIRQEALEGVVRVGGPTVPLLLAGLRGVDADIAAGCAESLRQQPGLPNEVVAEILADLRSGCASLWTTWLVGHLPRERLATAIADLQRAAPHLHYAVSVLWSFVESWIARRWELLPIPGSETLPDV
jgi:hypothetical protein